MERRSGERPREGRDGAIAEFIRFHPLLSTHRMDGGPDLGETVWLESSTDEEQVMAAMSAKARNKVRRARRDEVVVSAESGPGAIRTFTGLYHETLEAPGKSAPLDGSYFPSYRTP